MIQTIRRNCFKKTTENWGDSFKLTIEDTLLLEVTLRVIEDTIKVAVWGDDDGGRERYFTTLQEAEACFDHLMTLENLTHAQLKTLGFDPA